MKHCVTFVASLAFCVCFVIPGSGTQSDPRLDERWKLFKFGDPNIPIYEGEKTEEYLNLCGAPGNEICPTVVDSKACILNCNDKRLQSLKNGKIKVIDIRRQVANLYRSGLLWSLWFTIAALGTALFAVGQFRFINLPIFGDPFVDDPTDGIKFSHYMWMRWVIIGNKNFHWLTYIKPDAFIFRWVPISMQPWERPATPQTQRVCEPRDYDHPPWVIEDILNEKRALGEPTWNVLEEYWIRIYSWAWSRYRYQEAPHIVHRASEASCRNL